MPGVSNVMILSLIETTAVLDSAGGPQVGEEGGGGAHQARGNIKFICQLQQSRPGQ